MIERKPHHKIPPLSDAQIAAARRMKDVEMLSYEAIGEYFGRSHQTMRRYLDPEYKRLRNEQVNRSRRKRGNYGNPPYKGFAHIIGAVVDNEKRNPRFDPKRDGSPTYRTEFSELLGEPPIGRSALDQKMRA